MSSVSGAPSRRAMPPDSRPCLRTSPAMRWPGTPDSAASHLPMWCWSAVEVTPSSADQAHPARLSQRAQLHPELVGFTGVVVEVRRDPDQRPAPEVEHRDLPALSQELKLELARR